jgi:TPR repeat protein
MAADQGVAEAQSNLGHRFPKGVGVAKDNRKAARFFRMAAEQGLAEGQYNLGFCYSFGYGVNQDPGEAARLFLLAAKQGHSPAIDSCRALTLGRKCAQCGKIGLKQDGLKYCGGCKTTAYCSPEHQRAHWKTHKPECRAARESGGAASAGKTEEE